ncbi:NADH:ubiquinone oxidoreductase subunit N [Candidatus Acidianus copahuensis]|uniref:NADH:ubiquinone oxidoreductase subunit N n=1 Tax=Candidatus Acidianus copahuensis TaxID=1160895 RepID=A0A031LQG0_9CREN|nr:NADH-quinone oxidoreductase subunit NuoN [Candidatus Acidianus copahuensis]EZQ06985.1 NADH:ubiquinone oxidoreductase subunit N [Candidatus Acidianus copahuensis]
MILDYLTLILPSIFLLASSISILYLDNGSDKGFSNAYKVAIISSILALFSLIFLWSYGVYGFTLFSNTIYVDQLGYLFAISSLIGLVVVLVGLSQHIHEWKTRSSMLSLLLLSGLGIIYMSFAYNVLVILTAWGISSAASYAIVMLRKDENSVSAGIKYLIMGLVSSSFMILGFAFYIVATGTLSLHYQVQYSSLMFMAIAFLAVSFLFKIGAFPFQGWLPDVYTKADRISVAFISSIGKLIGIIPLVKVLSLGDPTHSLIILTVVLFSAISIASMTVGNVIAFSRNDVASVLSFSSVAQMGFIAIGFATIEIDPKLAEAGLVIQSLAYVLAQAGLFNLVNHVEKVSGTSRLEGIRGLSKSDKSLTAASTILLLSLLGLPPILGFWGKLFLFESAFDFPWLIIIAVINSAISSGYYIPIIREMFREGNSQYVKSDERDSVIMAAILSIGIGLISPLLLVIL